MSVINDKIVLAGGCFWGLEELFRQLSGVIDTEVGYCGGSNELPTYQNHPGHAEAVELVYDSSIVTLNEIFDFFFRVHNPTTLNQQGNDRGTSYRSAIFFENHKQRQVAESFIKLVDESSVWGLKVVTSLEPLEKFYPAEEYHQDYLQKNPNGYTCHFIQQESFL